ncbi:murein transglycosylase A [Methylobacterium sp. J-092]|uniref:murein transglycosylase A n=1 Tax=Methylobacterium sp. J-092 TaxID=2836667 RepID=UPI001FBA483E|nr:murein transglycosylase A [Methylobacterium sp. J-092]MCJ2006508.1 murein transglycosylase A [Methylobacterium sp. J-092]
MPPRHPPRPTAAFRAAVALVSGAAAASAAEPLRVGNAVLEPVAIAALPGWQADETAAAFDAFRRTCAAPGPDPAQAAGVAGSPADLAAACTAAAALDRTGAGWPERARRFFQERFSAYRVVRPADGTEPERKTGFLTGYFEPQLEGSLAPGPGFAAAVLARPDDLVTLAPGETRPGLDPALRAGRAAAAGFEAYPDRAAIEDGAIAGRTRPLLWLRDAVDLFVLQVQGSGRVRLPDGSAIRVLYDGKNGRPYTSIGKLLVAEGHLALNDLSLARWTAWLRAHPDHARRLMRMNASYIFFRTEPVTDPALGPPGAAGAPLSPGRSLAVDGTLWRYGLPFWLEGRLPGQPGSGHLVVAADTGSAILGPARGDLYVGTGAAAGVAAGDLHTKPGFVVLLPKPAAP